MTGAGQGGAPCWLKCRALLFDKDGTLVNFRLLWLSWCREVIGALSGSYRADVVDKSMEAWGVDLALGRIDPGGYLAVGTTSELRDSLAARLAENGYSADKTGPDVAEAVKQAYRAVEDKKLVQPIAGVGRAVKALHGQGYRLAVVTTDDTDQAAAHLWTMGLETYFEVVIGGDRVDRSKPAPDLALEACRLLGVQPAEAAVIGDTLADVQMARAAGTACAVGVASGVTPAAELAAEADVVLESAASMAGQPGDRK